MKLVSHSSGRTGRSNRNVPICPYCFSEDTMEPFRKPSRVMLLSRILPRLRRRYCRSCTRHFLVFVPRSAVSDPRSTSIPLALDTPDDQR